MSTALTFGSNSSQGSAVATQQLNIDTDKDMEYLTPEEQNEAIEFAKQIQLSDTSAINIYGAGPTNSIAQFSEMALKKRKESHVR